MPSLIDELQIADAQDAKQRSAQWAKLSEIVWRSDRPAKGDAGAGLKLVDALNAGLESKDPRLIDRAKLTGWILAVQRIRSLEPTAGDLPARQDRLNKHEEKAKEFDANRRRIIANLEREREGIIGEGRAAKALVDAGQAAARQIAELTDELGVAFGQIDVAARSRRRTLRQAVFGGPKETDIQNLDLEQIMLQPGGFSVPARDDVVLLTGQSSVEVDALHALIASASRDGRPGVYLLGPVDAERATSYRNLVLLVDHEAKTRKAAWQTMQFPFPVDFNVETGLCTHQFVLAPNQSPEDLSARAAALLKWHRAWHAANKSAEWRSPAALESERFGGDYHRPLADRAAPMSERPT